jgi:hypothetical protein
MADRISPFAAKEPVRCQRMGDVVPSRHSSAFSVASGSRLAAAAELFG